MKTNLVSVLLLSALGAHAQDSTPKTVVTTRVVCDTEMTLLVKKTGATEKIRETEQHATIDWRISDLRYSVTYNLGKNNLGGGRQVLSQAIFRENKLNDTESLTSTWTRFLDIDAQGKIQVEEGRTHEAFYQKDLQNNFSNWLWKNNAKAELISQGKRTKLSDGSLRTFSQIPSNKENTEFKSLSLTQDCISKEIAYDSWLLLLQNNSLVQEIEVMTSRALRIDSTENLEQNSQYQFFKNDWEKIYLNQQNRLNAEIQKTKKPTPAPSARSTRNPYERTPAESAAVQAIEIAKRKAREAELDKLIAERKERETRRRRF